MLSDTMMLGGSGRKAAYSMENALLFRGGQYLSRTPSATGSKRKFSIAAWVRSPADGILHPIVSAGDTNAAGFALAGLYEDSVAFYMQLAGPVTYMAQTVAKLRDPSAWYHVVIYVDLDDGTPANRVKVYVNGIAQAMQSVFSGYPVTADLDMNTVGKPMYVGRRYSSGAFNAYAGDYLAEVVYGDGVEFSPSSFGEVDSFTQSWKPKAVSGIPYGTNGFHLGKPWNSASLGTDYSGLSGLAYVPGNVGTPNGTFTSGGGNAAAFDGVEPKAAAACAYDVGLPARLGMDYGSSPIVVRGYRLRGSSNEGLSSGANNFNLYLRASNTSFGDAGATLLDTYAVTDSADIVVTRTCINTTAYRYVWLDADDAPTANGYWAQLMFLADGQSNHWTPVGFVASDVVSDTPTNVFATLNPLDRDPSLALTGFSSGNLTVTGTDTTRLYRSTMWMLSGKWYWEVRMDNYANGSNCWGVAKEGAIPAGYWLGQSGNQIGYGYYPYGAGSYGLFHNGSNIGTGVVPAVSGDVLGFAFDADTGQLWLAKNGTWMNSGNPPLGTGFVASNIPVPVCPAGNETGSGVTSFNFGQKAFTYAAPTGFKALCTANLPATTGQTSGSFTGNANADGPCILTGAVPVTLTINGNAVTWGTHADKLATGFKIRTSSASYNASGSNSWVATYNKKPTVGSNHIPANAQANP